MTPRTVPTRPAPLNVAADVIAQMVDTVDGLVDAPAEARAGWIETLIVGARVLTRLVDRLDGPGVHEELAGRLWMIGMSASEASSLASVTAASYTDHLIEPADTARIARTAIGALGGAR